MKAMEKYDVVAEASSHFKFRLQCGRHGRMMIYLQDTSDEERKQKVVRQAMSSPFPKIHSFSQLMLFATVPKQVLVAEIASIFSEKVANIATQNWRVLVQNLPNREQK